jgi:hypothetical protein
VDGDIVEKKREKCGLMYTGDIQLEEERKKCISLNAS